MKEPISLHLILAHFGMRPPDWHCVSFGSGLINSTWALKSRDGRIRYILQMVNHQVFRHPEYIACNVELIRDHLLREHPGYLFAAPLKGREDQTLFQSPEGTHYRIFPFVGDSRTLDVVHHPGQAYEASRSFARFSRLLDGLNPRLLKETLPAFHDLSRRYQDFEKALAHSEGRARRAGAAEAIDALKDHSGYVHTFEELRRQPDFRVRVIHHDTKISNVLFDPRDKALCVIDLDTVMPGYFISDLGDMMRTYLSPVSEEEKDCSAISIRPEYFEAIVKGYLEGIEGGLTALEMQQFLYAGRFMMYMQALRFLTDHLQGDVYYGARYEGHNLVRARNQIRLLSVFNEQETPLRAILDRLL